MQIPLDIKLNDIFTFDGFSAGPNAELVRCLQELDGSGTRFVYVQGGEGNGKTHLLQALCRQWSDTGKTVLYLPLADRQAFDSRILDNAESLGLVAIDDIDAIGGDDAWEQALFHFYNRARDNADTCVVITGNAAPQDLGIRLPDLVSRLSWGLVYTFRPLADSDRLEALVLRAGNRGLELSNEVGSYLLNNCPRDLPYLLDLLDKLDEASLVEKRRITIPFLKSVL